MAEHFVQPPRWEWWILGYFFLAGLAGGCYTLATMFRWLGSPRDEGVARLGYLIPFPLIVVCGLFLTIDLGQPLRFWHMLINTTPGEPGANYKYWSPMSVGVWALLIFGIFAFVSFLEVLSLDRRGPATRITEPPGIASRIFAAIGCIFALFIASYTGVLLSVSNQPIWSDTWTLGALFLASGLSGSAALLSWLSMYRTDAAPETEVRLRTADGYFALLELIAIVLLFITIAGAGQLSRALAAPWLILWILVLASLVPPLMGLAGRRAWLAPGGGAAVTVATAAQYTARSAVVVLIGVFLMRAVVIFSAQF